MIATTYTVLTPHGVFLAMWDDDEEAAVVYGGSVDAIAYFRDYMTMHIVTGDGGAILDVDALEPGDLYGFCQSETYGIAVHPGVDELIAQADDEQSMPTLDSVLPEDLIRLTVEVENAIREADSTTAGISKLRLAQRIRGLKVMLSRILP